MRPTVVLFDIDGTLLRADGAGRRCFTEAFLGVFGVADAFSGVPFSGRTDLDLLARACAAHLGRAATAPEARSFFEGYHRALEADLRLVEGCEVLPAVEEVLSRLSRRAQVAVGLATGNAELGAQIKLHRAGLEGWFRFGGYGSDDADRQVLTRLGAERGVAHLGSTWSETQVVVVGDSEHDVRCAHGIGAAAVAVQTGWTPVETLAAERPEVLVADLTTFGAWAGRFGLA